MSAVNAAALLASAGGDYQISRSVRLRSSASAYLNKTFAAAGNRKKWTYSAWMKRGTLGTYGALIASKVDGNNYSSLEFSGDELRFVQASGGSITANKRPAQLFRDPSAWYHVIAAMDTDNATAEDRFILYINGTRVTAWAANTPPALGLTTGYINSTTAQWIGLDANPLYFDGYLTEINFIDGQALTASSFGEIDAITGVWKPKKYAGTYGTNGFYLNFSDNSSNTATTIGKDYSGNGNNWTPNNISVTSGATYDSMLDVPTMWADGGNGRSNYAVMNPLNQSSVSAAPTNGNLTVSQATNFGQVASSIGMSSGKWYYEHTITAIGGENSVGIGGTLYNNAIIGANTNQYGYYFNGNKYINGTFSSYGASFTTGDIIGVAYDADTGSLTFYKNGTTQGVATTGITGQMFALACTRTAGGQNISDFNFGQRPFAYTPPTGFKALNTQNLPDATIKKGNAYFDVSTWSGNASTQSVVNSGLMQPDLVWAKARGGTAGGAGHIWQDAVRGLPYYLQSNTTGAEGSAADHITSFNSNGFSMGAGGSINAASTTYVGWQWKESASAGFDIVTFTNPSSGSSSFAHSLGVKPSMIIVKARSNTSNWTCTHKSLGTNMADKWINLESTAAVQTSSNIWGGEPTSSVFYCGTGIQVASATMVAYLFAEVAGYSKFGSYTGNGVANGPFVYLGFRPRYIMLKVVSNGSYWWMIKDSSRDTYNASTKELYANVSDAEYTASGYDIDFVSNGFKIRSNGNALNGSGDTFIYAAFAENPFKNSLAR